MGTRLGSVSEVACVGEEVRRFVVVNTHLTCALVHWTLKPHLYAPNPD